MNHTVTQGCHGFSRNFRVRDLLMDIAFRPFNPNDHDACRLQAAMLMQTAIDLLDQAGEKRVAVHLQHAIDTLALRLPVTGVPH